MRRITINPHNVYGSLQEIMRASNENDIVDIAQAFTIQGANTQTTTLNVSAPTLANAVAVLATLIQVMQKGGLSRTT